MGSIRPCLLFTAALTASLAATTGAQSFGCTPAEWKTYHAKLKCSNNYGGKSSVIELAHDGDWTHAYQEVDVVPNAVYRISGEFYPLVLDGDCEKFENSPKVSFCSPSVAVCSGAYNGEPSPLCAGRIRDPALPRRLCRCDLRSVRCFAAHTPARMHLHAFRLCVCSQVLLPRHLPELGSARPASKRMGSV